MTSTTTTTSTAPRTYVLTRNYRVPLPTSFFIVYGEWVNLAIVSARALLSLTVHPYCTDGDILLFLYLLANVPIVSRFGYKRLLNALNINVNVLTSIVY